MKKKATNVQVAWHSINWICNAVTEFARKVSQRITDFSVLPIKKFRPTWKSRSTKGLLSYNRSCGFVVDVKVSRGIFENIRGFPDKISECKKENTLQGTVEVIKLSAQMSYAITVEPRYNEVSRYQKKCSL